MIVISAATAVMEEGMVATEDRIAGRAMSTSQSQRKSAAATHLLPRPVPCRYTAKEMVAITTFTVAATETTVVLRSPQAYRLPSGALDQPRLWTPQRELHRSRLRLPSLQPLLLMKSTQQFKRALRVAMPLRFLARGRPLQGITAAAAWTTSQRSWSDSTHCLR